ncbi:C45 family peptidase [uncultured Roseobacter sp.]|uniref:C45 family autoproteolytic acyltransferase/hydolase n=1 Tax=uncultured Roseobacter sp. TaxID=114847 RepID=UPI00261A2D62|nr:C45 family peptidase [uncultured Roseobacter sp.]
MSSEVQGVPIIEAAGSPTAIGAQIGAQIADRIKATIDLYKEIFAKTDAEILQAAAHFRIQIEGFAPDLAAEIIAMAEAANVDPGWLFALNARSELLSALAVGECTSLHFSGTPYMGQNWDWLEPLEDLMVLQRITDAQGHATLMLTEPGIVGKIGLNDAGIGVCLNFLPSTNPTLGVPTHVLLRQLLSARTWEDVGGILETAGTGRSANILIASAKGLAMDIEFDGLSACNHGAETTATLHTNHYLTSDIPVAEVLFENSDARLSQARALLHGEDSRSLDRLKAILSDRSNEDHPILAPYREVPSFRGMLGTDCSIAMDLARGEMHFRRGNKPDTGFEVVPVLKKNALTLSRRGGRTGWVARQAERPS